MICLRFFSSSRLVLFELLNYFLLLMKCSSLFVASRIIHLKLENMNRWRKIRINVFEKQICSCINSNSKRENINCCNKFPVLERNWFKPSLKIKIQKKIIAPGGIRTHVLRLSTDALPLSHKGCTWKLSHKITSADGTICLDNILN